MIVFCAFQMSNVMVGGFSWVIGITSSVQSELRAFKDGLLLAIDLEIPLLEIEMDSLVVVNLVNSNSNTNVFLSSIVVDCKCLLERFERFTLKHIYKEANGCVDILVKAGCDQQVDFLCFTTASTYVLTALNFNTSNVIHYCLV